MNNRERSAPSYPTIAQAFGIWGLYILLALSAGLLASLFGELTGWLNTSWQTFIAYTIAGILILWFAYKKKKRKEQPKAIFQFRPVAFLIYLLLFFPEILILDEATSNLDSLSENKVFDTLMRFKSSGKSIIIIAHRLNTIKKADHIIFMKKGKVTESGTHDELIQSGKDYYQLWKNQFPVNIEEYS